jgi:hypothetical protein
MEPVTLATLTTAAWALLNEAGGEAIWDGVKSLFVWKKKPAPEMLAREIAESLLAHPELQAQLVELIQRSGVSSAGQLVGSISGAKKVAVVQHVHGDFKM